MTRSDPEGGPDRTGGESPDGRPGETASGSRRAVVAVALAAGAIAIAAVAGLTAGRGSSDDSPAVGPPPAKTVELARDETRREIAATTFRQGYEQGRKAGLRHGRMTGRRSGRLRGRIAIAERNLASAQSEAAAAQSELSGMTAAPSTP